MALHVQGEVVRPGKLAGAQVTFERFLACKKKVIGDGVEFGKKMVIDHDFCSVFLDLKISNIDIKNWILRKTNSILRLNI